MAKNVFDQSNHKPDPKKPQKIRTRPTIGQEMGNFLSSVFRFPALTRSNLYKFIFVVVMIMLFITFNHSYISLLSNIGKASKELSSKRALYLDKKGKIERQQRQSEIDITLKSLGSEVGITTQPPVKIVIKTKPFN